MAINRHTDQFYLDAYSGNGGFENGQYLVRFPIESDAKFAYRKDAATYPNMTKKVVDIYSGFLWREPPARQGGDLYGRFMADADGAGRGLGYLLKSWQRQAMLLGTVYAIVDKPPGQAATAADEKMPFLIKRRPGDVEAREFDDRNRLTSITFVEMADGKTRYRTYNQTGWVLAEDAEKKRIIEQGEHNLGRPPVVALHSAVPLDDTDLRASGFAHDLAQLNFDLYQQRSRIDRLFADQAFSILALPARDQQERERLSGVKVGTSNGLTYDPEGGGKPEYLAPPDGPAKTQMEWYAQTVMDMYRQANLEFVGGVQASGVALAFHFQEANSALSEMADLCEQAEREIAWLVHAWQGENFDGSIVYPRNFNLADLEQELRQGTDALSLGLGPEFEKALKKRLARQVLGNDTAPSVLAAIDTEIDAQGDTYGDRVAQAAGGAGVAA